MCEWMQVYYVYRRFVFENAIVPSMFSKLLRAGNEKHSFHKPAYWLAFIIQEDILLIGHFERIAFWIKTSCIWYILFKSIHLRIQNTSQFLATK